MKISLILIGLTISVHILNVYTNSKRLLLNIKIWTTTVCSWNLTIVTFHYSLNNRSCSLIVHICLLAPWCKDCIKCKRLGRLPSWCIRVGNLHLTPDFINFNYCLEALTGLFAVEWSATDHHAHVVITSRLSLRTITSKENWSAFKVNVGLGSRAVLS